MKKEEFELPKRYFLNAIDIPTLSIFQNLPDLSLITSLSFSNLSLYMTGILLSLLKLLIDYLKNPKGR